jgi:uncharacterized protein YggE
VPREFVARNSIEVRVDEIARVGELLDIRRPGRAPLRSAASASTSRSATRPSARRCGCVSTRAAAPKPAAAGAGRAIDRIVKIEDSREAGALPPPRPMMMMKSADAAETTPVEPGLIEIRARVTLTASMR